MNNRRIPNVYFQCLLIVTSYNYILVLKTSATKNLSMNNRYSYPRDN